MLIVLGFFISAVVFYVLNLAFPVPDMDQIDDVDVYGTFTTAEAHRIGVVPLSEYAFGAEIAGTEYIQTSVVGGEKAKALHN
jgi:NCS1 family nucleobase:cation symporter-1